MTAIAEEGLSLGDALGAALHQQAEYEARNYAFARQVAAIELASGVAQALGADWGDVWDEMTHVPDNMLALLESPQGWSVLASYVAESIGRALHSYSPTVH